MELPSQKKQEELYILGAFPGDALEVQIYKRAEGKTYAEIISIVEASPHRIHTPEETPFFDPNAPWQYFDPKQEQIEKKTIVNELFNQIDEIIVHSEIASPGSQNTHYRNKAAYSFMHDRKGQLSFALYSRGTSLSKKIPHVGNILVHEAINRVGEQFLHFFNQKNVPLETLKYLVLRYSYHTGSVVAQILVTETNRKKLPWKKFNLEIFMNQHSKLKGILVSHSLPDIRASLTTKDFYKIGDTESTEEVLGKKYNYHPSQFFQIYPEGFSGILSDCEDLVFSIPKHDSYELLDLFAGVGIIGIHLAHLVGNVHGVEQSPLAEEYALKNAEQNNILNFQFTQANVNQALSHIKPNQILAIDPPRSGLTTQVQEKILEIKPEYIMYISCNPETQARDYDRLKELYNIKFSKAYNLFPKTSHVEHLIFLKRKY